LRGGLSTKIHLTIDALGNLLRWILTGGEVADITQARPLIEGLNPEAVIGDKGYDADALVAYIQDIRRGGDPAAQHPHRTPSV
jgi:transposase